MNYLGKTKNEIFLDLLEMQRKYQYLVESSKMEIARLKRNAEQSRASEEYYIDFYENAPVAHFSVGIDGRIKRCNLYSEQLLGYPREYYIGSFVIDLYADTPHGKAKASIIFQKIQSGQPVIDEELEMKRSNGEACWISLRANSFTDARGKICESHSIVVDITERKRAETQVRKLSQAVEQSPASIIITDPDGNIEYVNKKLVELTGYSYKEVIGKNPRIFKSDRFSGHDYKELWRTITSGKEWKGEFLNKKKNGELYWESAVISSIVNADGEIMSYLGVKEDITDRKYAEQALIKAKEKAEESDRLKMAFLANISHEIRTPMNGIIGFAELLKNSELTGEQHKVFIEIIQKSSNRMLETIASLIDISKIEAGQEQLNIKEIHIIEHLEYLYNFFKPEADAKGLRLILNIGLPEKYASINTDIQKLDSVLVNLIKNAIKFTDTGEIVISCIKKKDCVFFCVKDTGIGIPPEKLEAIFNRFEQVDISSTSGYEGWGLGLSISKSYVEMLGGKIWLESKPGKGSTFGFSITLGTEKRGYEMMPEHEDTMEKITEKKNLKYWLSKMMK